VSGRRSALLHRSKTTRRAPAPETFGRRRRRRERAPFLRYVLRSVFAGDRRVWLAALAGALPLLGLVCFYCLRPVDYNTGSDSVEVSAYPVYARAGQRVCLPGLAIPAHTERLRLQFLPQQHGRPRLQLSLTAPGRQLQSALPASRKGAPHLISHAVFTVPALAAAVVQPATACLTASAPVRWGGAFVAATDLGAGQVTLDGVPRAARIAVWYEPRRGAQQSYLGGLGTILARAALFRPAPVGAWTYYLVLFVVLPGLALAALRMLALAAAGRLPRRAGAALYTIAVLNFACWALVSPPWQAPDEVDHFAYTQSLVERGQAPSRSVTSPLPRWSSAERLALEAVSFESDHLFGETTPPWLSRDERRYRRSVALLDPSAADGGGNETAATHGPIYYAALAPAYLAAGSSPFAQLTLMRLTSALIGALVVVCTFLLVRELVRGRQWPPVLAALLVAFQPMFAFLSGAVNNDVGVDAGAAALELMMIRLLRRGLTLRDGVITAALAVLLPEVKGTVLSLYPLLAAVLVVALWRERSRWAPRSWAVTGGVGIAVWLASRAIFSVWKPKEASGGGTTISASTEAVSSALQRPADYLAYLWQVFLPRLSFMTRHFHTEYIPAYIIFDQRGWAAFGWYTVIFPEVVYEVLLWVMVAFIPLALLAAARERRWLSANRLSAAALILMPILVVAGFEAAFYVPGIRPALG